MKKQRKIGARLASILEYNTDVVIHAPAMQCKNPDCDVSIHVVYGSADRYCSRCGCGLTESTTETEEMNEILYDTFVELIKEFGKLE
jgi:uncharacterized paraquat-inducible protein A